MKIEIDLERLADELAALVAKRLEEQIGTPEPSLWMCMADAITTRASRRARSASGWAELDAALGCVPQGPIPRRSPSGGLMSRKSSNRKRIERGLYLDGTRTARARPHPVAGPQSAKALGQWAGSGGIAVAASAAVRATEDAALVPDPDPGNNRPLTSVLEDLEAQWSFSTSASVSAPASTSLR